MKADQAARLGEGLIWLRVMIAVGFGLALFLVTEPARAAPPVNVHFFWSEGCPHCREMAASLDRIAAREADIMIHRYEVTRSSADAALYSRVVEQLDLPSVVPIVIVGESVMVGHSAQAEETIGEMIMACRRAPCREVLDAAAPPLASAPRQPDHQLSRVRLPQTIRVPLVGQVDAAGLSLPVLTIAMAAVDGFNPCAMWVLVFLIGLLLGIKDRRRMWLLGGTFLFATAGVYFLFLSAWLNLLLVIGTLAWLRFAIGALALVAGGAYVRQGLRPEEVCPVTQPERRRRIFERLRRLVEEPSLTLAMTGIALLAVAVNVVELLCSAGIPAVYTSVLARADLPLSAYYGYLLLYVLVFLADDVAVVAIAMTTLSLAGIDAAYTRWARLAGGGIMIGIGALLILRPGWLSFAP